MIDKSKGNNIGMDIEEIKGRIEDLPYNMVDGSFNYNDHSFVGITNDGYKFVVNDKALKNNTIPSYFHINNPYTIENINNYIIQNNIDSKLLSTNYSGSLNPMEWMCKCGNIFKISWKQFKRGKHYCDKCEEEISAKSKMRSIDEIVSVFRDNGYKVIDVDGSLPVSKQKIGLEDCDGYKYQVDWAHFICGNNKPWKFGKTNKYTIENINRYLYLTDRKDYRCISKQYINNKTPLDILHIPCGTIFQMTLVDIQKRKIKGSNHYYKSCPKCFPVRKESLHASILKQVFLHEYPDTIVEDKSCINSLTGHILPTDIVNHRLKIAIEIQSDYHDKEKQKEKDKIKKDFWISMGYSFYDPDIRNYSILDMLKIFFPDMKKIPEYVDYNYSCNADVKDVQQYINNYCSVNEIADKTNIHIWIIYDMIYRNRVVLPKDYKEKNNAKKRIVQLDLNFNLIDTFPSRAEVYKKLGYDQSILGKAVHGKIKEAYGYIWMFENNYLNIQTNSE